MSTSEDNLEKIWNDISIISAGDKNNAEQFLLDILNEKKNATNNPVNDISDSLEFTKELLGVIDKSQLDAGTVQSIVLSRIGWMAKGSIAKHGSDGNLKNAKFVIVPKGEADSSQHNFDLIYGDIQRQNASDMFYKSVTTLEEADEVLLEFFKTLNVQYQGKNDKGQVFNMYRSGSNFNLDAILFKIAGKLSRRGDIQRLKGYINYVVIPGLVRELETEKSREERLRKYYQSESLKNTPKRESINVVPVENDIDVLDAIMADDDDDDADGFWGSPEEPSEDNSTDEVGAEPGEEGEDVSHDKPVFAEDNPDKPVFAEDNHDDRDKPVFAEDSDDDESAEESDDSQVFGEALQGNDGSAEDSDDNESDDESDNDDSHALGEALQDSYGSDYSDPFAFNDDAFSALEDIVDNENEDKE